MLCCRRIFRRAIASLRSARQCRLLSNAIAQRCELTVNDYAQSQQWQTRWPVQLPPLICKGRSVRFSRQDLSALGVQTEFLAPFILDTLSGLLDMPFGDTALGRRPLLVDGAGVTLPIPSLVSPALRLHLAHAIARRIVPQEAVVSFHQNQFARWLGCDFPARGARALLNDGLDIPTPEFDLPGDYAHAVVRFDADKLAHVVLIEADWSHPPSGRFTKHVRQAADLNADW